MGCNNTKHETIYDDITINNAEKFIPDIQYGKVIKVYDGDTITAVCPVFNSNNKKPYKFSIRIRGIDCPELRTKNVIEKEMAEKAKMFVYEKVFEKIVSITNVTYDKYGRILADVIKDGKNIGELLCEKRLAVKYFGGTKKTPKCWKQYYQTGKLN
tara:strand:- start:5772 stop:6239 length:468 start_codon:yes stop_codon:yes gene_type:complete